MQRKATKNTRGPNAAEKRFQGWLKHHGCVWCDAMPLSIVDHCRGATFKHNKTLVGHWFCLPQCLSCDTQKTTHGKRQGNEAEAWLEVERHYFAATAQHAPSEVIAAIQDWGK